MSSITLTRDEIRLLTLDNHESDQWAICLADPRRGCPLDNNLRSGPIFEGKDSASLSSIGLLSTSPIEIKLSILDAFDLQSLTNFRAVSWGARALVDSLPS
jgi:hypothetical protein